MSLLVETEHLAKRYRLGGMGGLFRRGAGESLWALDDLSLRVRAGESVGLIGHNGAGKTTTLRLLAGITRPTHGRIRVQGRVASLINLGAGFHRELTGRENIMLNGVVLGLTRAEVRERFEAIAAFADLGDYLDTPVKQYSSGMYARLGFSVATHVDPDVLLVDEVLSVGDVAFQDRGLRRMLSFQDRGCAVIFVSHNLSAVEMMCQRVVWLDHGRVRLEGPTAEVVRAYLEAVDKDLIRGARTDVAGSGGGDEGEPVSLESVTVHADDGSGAEEVAHGAPLVVRAHIRVRRPTPAPACRIALRGDYGTLLAVTGRSERSWEPGRHTLQCRLAPLPLMPGVYRVVAVLIGDSAGPSPVAEALFRVIADPRDFGSASAVAATKSRGGFLMVPYSWTLHVGGGPARAIPGLHAPPGTNFL